MLLKKIAAVKIISILCFQVLRRFEMERLADQLLNRNNQGNCTHSEQFSKLIRQ